MDKRILLVDVSILGHRMSYIDGLRNGDNFFCLLPEESSITYRYNKMRSGFNLKRNIVNYFKLIREINLIVQKNSVEIVHLLCGDALYRFWGLGLNKIKAKVIVTFHSMVPTKIKQISFKMIFNKINYGIVHTDFLIDQLRKVKIYNVEHIEYPAFKERIEVSTKDSKRQFGLPLDVKTLSVIGGTSSYKGYDILFRALSMVKRDFHLMICGRECDYTKVMMQEKIEEYKDKVTLEIRLLDDVEYQHAIIASDILLLPYRSNVNGASGPLADSTVYGKMIIASDSGSLKKIVLENHLGMTFKEGNPVDLARVIDQGLSTAFEWDSVAEEYRVSLSPERFKEKYHQIYQNI